MQWLRNLWLFIFFRSGQRELAEKYLANADSLREMKKHLKVSSAKIADKKGRLTFIADMDKKINQLRHERSQLENELRVAKCTPEQLKRLHSRAK
jgi:hypothetical protein